MVGYRRDGWAGLAFAVALSSRAGRTSCALSGVDALAHLDVELRHCESWTARGQDE